MLDLTAIERVGMTNRIFQIQQRIANIQEQFQVDKFPTDFQSKLDKEIERQEKLDATKNNPAQEISSTPQNIAPQQVNPAQNNSTRVYITEEDMVNAAKILFALASGNAAVPNVVTPSANRIVEDKPFVNSNFEDETPSGYNYSDDNYSYDNSRHFTYSNSYGSTTEDLLNTSAQRNGVDPNLVRAVAIAESDMNQNEISPVGAIGVMQLMPETAAALGVDPYDEADNIEGGVRYLRQMLDQFGGHVPTALAAYNAGPAAVQRYGGIPPYSETQNYVGRILDIMGG